MNDMGFSGAAKKLPEKNMMTSNEARRGFKCNVLCHTVYTITHIHCHTVYTFTPIHFHTVYTITPIHSHTVYTFYTPSASSVGTSHHGWSSSTRTAILLVQLVMPCPDRYGQPPCWYILSCHVRIDMDSHLIGTSYHLATYSLELSRHIPLACINPCFRRSNLGTSEGSQS